MITCPHCQSANVKNHGNGQDYTDGGDLYVAIGEDSVEIYDGFVELYKCDNGHSFYLSAEEQKPNYP